MYPVTEPSVRTLPPAFYKAFRDIMARITPSRISSFLLYGLLFFSSVVTSQTYTPIKPVHQVEPYRLHLDIDPSGMNSAVQAPDGYLWISATKGLIISDGQGSAVYTHDDPLFNLPLRKPDEFIGNLRMDSLGHIYAETSSGHEILQFDSHSRSIQSRWTFKASAVLASFYFDCSPEGEVFVLTSEQNKDTFSVWLMDKGQEQRLLFQGLRSDYGVVEHFDCLQSMVWIQTTQGILRISSDGHRSDFYAFHTLSQSNYFAPFKGEYYYFYDDGYRSLMYWDAHMPSPRTYLDLPKGINIISGSFLVQNEKVYLANGYSFIILDTLRQTLEDLSSESYQMKKEVLPDAISEDIMGFYALDEEIFLLGSKYLYVLTSKPPPKENFEVNMPFTRPDVSMRGLAEDEHQQIYASYYTGIILKPRGKEQFIEWPLIGKLDKGQYSAYSLTYHAPWLFWHSLGINTHTGQIKTIIPNRTNGHVVHVVSGDTLWLYSWYGSYLYAFDIRHQALDSIRLDHLMGQGQETLTVINKMVIGADGASLWLASGKHGICHMSEQGQLLRLYSTESLGLDQLEGINDIWLDDPYIWYTCNQGLGRLYLPTGMNTLFKDPLITSSQQQRPRNFFTLLPADRQGFYLGSEQGIVYFDTVQLQFAHLPPEHPLAKPEFNRTSAFRDSQGRYYFGSTNGLFTFLPDDLVFQSAPTLRHPVKLYGISVFNGEEKKYRYLTAFGDSLQEIVLHPSETNIKCYLSSPSFDHAVYYSYRIKGMQDTWSEYAADPVIHIYALPAGHYTLEVKASANAHDSNALHFRLPLVMSAYWYQKPWVWVLAFLGLMALVTFAIRYWYQQKWKRQKALEALRIKISSDLHDDVGSILSGLAMQSQVMSYEVDESKRKPLLELSAMSREAMERMRDTVWAIDARKDTYENLVDRMRDFAERSLERKNITHTFTIEGLEGKKFISPEIRQNIYLIFKEAITNVIRHSDATHVEIRFVQHTDQLTLMIQDNGTTMTGDHHSGQGIGNMKMRAERIGGKLEIFLDNGWRVVLDLHL